MILPSRFRRIIIKKKDVYEIQKIVTLKFDNGHFYNNILRTIKLSI